MYMHLIKAFVLRWLIGDQCQNVQVITVAKIYSPSVQDLEVFQHLSINLPFQANLRSV